MRICIFGQKENGKTTLAKMIQEQLWRVLNTFRPTGMQFPAYDAPSIIQLSTPLKECLSLASGRHIEWLMNNKNMVPPNWRMTVREGMQKLSDCIKSIINDDIWVDRIKAVEEFIIDDGRYLFELEKLQPDTFCILLFRPTHINSDPHSSESWLRSLWHDYQVHFDETLKGFHKVIINDGSLEDLKRKVDDEIIPHYLVWEQLTKVGEI